MFDKCINWVSKYPYLHIFFLTFIFFGLFMGWLILMAPFHLWDGFRKDFIPYFEGIQDIWETRKDE